MNETKKTIIILIVIFAIIMLLPLSLYIKQTNGKKILNAFNEIYTKDDNSLIYIGSSNCSFCEQFDPVIESVSENYDFTYVYIDILDLTNQQFSELLDKLDIDKDKFGTPYLVVGEKGKKVGEKPGYMDKNNFVEFLIDNGFLDEDAEPKNKDEDNKDTDALNFIEIDEYESLIKSNEKNIIVQGQTGCGACVQAKPILNKIAKEKNIKINYIEIDLIDNEKDYNIWLKTLEGLGIDELYTPHIMVVQNKKQLDSITGLTTENDYIELFKEHGFIK